MDLVEIRIRPYWNPECYEYENMPLDRGRWCIVEREEGEEIGMVVNMPKTPDAWGEPEIAGKVVRVATPSDLMQHQENVKLEKEAAVTCKEKIQDHELPMKLVLVEYLFDRSKLKFYFTSETRVDFRELVRDLAYVFKTRIELRQIGVRDESKILGGFGICGRPFCCASFIRNFDPITIKMAKEQNLALNPTKISGCCGRLMCCLAYEYDFYHGCRNEYPKLGSRVEYDKSDWIVESVNMIKRSLFIRNENTLIEVNLDDVSRKKSSASGSK